MSAAQVLEDKVVVVVGVGPGLGREVAQAALRDGARVTVAARNEERLAKIANELDPSGERVLAQPVDMSDDDACKALMQATADRFGGIDAIVNVAALDTLFGTLQTQKTEDWMASMSVNVVGNVQVARAAVPHMKTRGGGSIVLVGSQSMWLAPPAPQIAYASAKGALVSAMYHMADELGPDGIRVNMVIPTWMWGPPVEMYVKGEAKRRRVPVEEVVAEITASMPLGEIPTDGDVAESCVFFCSDRARMITGETLQVNAGQLMR